MKNKIFLKVITPHGLFWNDEVDIVTLETTEGQMGILHGKSPFVASLKISELHINAIGSKEHVDCAVAGGLVYVTPERIEIITDAIEDKSKIDLHRAEKAKKEAEIELNSKKDAADQHLAQMALKRALNRITVKSH